MIQLRRILLVEGLIAFAAACARFTELIITKIIKANLLDRRFAFKVKKRAYFFKAFRERPIPSSGPTLGFQPSF